MEKKRSFARRPNADGSFDSICPRCFLTIATGVAEGELEAAEDGHICEEKRTWAVEELRRKRRATEGGTS